MKRHRHNDPLGVSDRPNVTTDPARVAEIQAETWRRFRYLKRHYQMEEGLGLGRKRFNEDLARLKAVIKSPCDSAAPKSRLNRWLETAINDEARRLAGLLADGVLRIEHASFVDLATVIVAKRAKALRGTPGRVELRRYVEGLMAIIQECTGLPVMAPRDDKDGIYDPQPSGASGRLIRRFVDELEPDVSDTKLSHWIREIRKSYAGRPMRFRDMFPGYGINVDPETGEPVAVPPLKILSFTANAPIYCP